MEASLVGHLPSALLSQLPKYSLHLSVEIKDGAQLLTDQSRILTVTMD